MIFHIGGYDLNQLSNYYFIWILKDLVTNTTLLIGILSRDLINHKYL